MQGQETQNNFDVSHGHWLRNCGLYKQDAYFTPLLGVCIYVCDSLQYKFNVAGLYSSFISPIKPEADVNLRIATLLQITYYKSYPNGPVAQSV
jgi:hypothetical protein